MRRLVAIAWAWLPVLALAAVVSGAAAYVVSSLLPRTFEAKATLLVGQALAVPNPDYNQLLVAQNLATTYAVVAETRPTLVAVINELDLEVTPEELAERISVHVPRDATLMTIAAQDGDARRAAQIANAVAKRLVAVSPAVEGDEIELQRSLEADLRATRQLIASTQARIDTLISGESLSPEQEQELTALTERVIDLRSTYTTLRSLSLASTSLVTILEEASPPEFAIWPRPLLTAILAACAGLAAVLALAISLAQRRVPGRLATDDLETRATRNTPHEILVGKDASAGPRADADPPARGASNPSRVDAG